ncbi:MAG: hypothetical protein PHU71_07615 [Candidatus Gracilibacteria bacterium]|nr:hypothetical protein [Candidatus Gracilibacteria bacterium]
MNYSQKDLDALWNIIKSHRNLFVGNYTGLLAVKFDLDIQLFEHSNKISHQKAVRDMETIVTYEIEKAIKILSLVDIRCHHLSCAADTGTGNNSALCIHYQDFGKDKFYALTIPGINYVPNQETRCMLEKMLKI